MGREECQNLVQNLCKSLESLQIKAADHKSSLALHTVSRQTLRCDMPKDGVRDRGGHIFIF